MRAPAGHTGDDCCMVNKKNKRWARAVTTGPRTRSTPDQERFRSLMRMSSELYWETDTEHRLRELLYGAGHRPGISPEQMLGKKRWEIPSVYPNAALWQAHVETL